MHARQTEMQLNIIQLIIITGRLHIESLLLTRVRREQQQQKTRLRDMPANCRCVTCFCRAWEIVYNKPYGQTMLRLAKNAAIPGHC